MPSEELRRKAGASGSGEAIGSEDQILGSSEKRAGKKEKIERKTPAQQAKILKPDVLTFPIERNGWPATLHVRVVPTIGDVLDRSVQDDITAYVELLMFEASKFSEIDISNPALLFAQENAPYLVIAVLKSNLQALLRSIVIKTGFVESEELDDDGNPLRFRVSNRDIDLLDRNQILRIGSSVFGREIEARLQRGKAKNAPRTAPA